MEDLRNLPSLPAQRCEQRPVEDLSDELEVPLQAGEGLAGSSAARACSMVSYNGRISFNRTISKTVRTRSLRPKIAYFPPNSCAWRQYSIRVARPEESIKFTPR